MNNWRNNEESFNLKTHWNLVLPPKSTSTDWRNFTLIYWTIVRKTVRMTSFETSRTPQKVLHSNKLTWNNSVTFVLFFADVSMNETFHDTASALPSNSGTSRRLFSSHLLPTSITGIWVISCPWNIKLNERIRTGVWFWLFFLIMPPTKWRQRKLKSQIYVMCVCVCMAYL